MKILTLQQAEEYLYSFIPKDTSYKFPGDLGLRRTKYLLSFLGDPQNKLKVVHIAGTSGKGSTAFYLGKILSSQRLKVGLHLSPHLVDLRERFQIDFELLTEQKFCMYLTELIPAIENVKQSEFMQPTYFEICVSLAYYIFYKEKVDYAVIETGLGGMFDGTNVVNNPTKIAVITRIGHDHMEILGKTLDKIASQKAGIIHKLNTVITINQKPTARKVIQEAAVRNNSKLLVIHKGIEYKNIRIRNNEIIFNFNYFKKEIKKIELHSTALYQVENVSLALTTCLYIVERDGLKPNEGSIVKILRESSFSGRMDIKNIKDKEVILDGAHNPQKMAAFISSLRKKSPQLKFDFLIAVKKGKDYKEMLNYIIPVAASITITKFFTLNQGFTVQSEDPTKIAAYLQSKKFSNYSINPSTIYAFKAALASASGTLVVTGSLYLLSELYTYFKKESF